MFKKQDLYIILPFLLAAAALFLWFGRAPSASGIAVVEKNGVEFGRYDLQKQKTAQVIDVGGPMNVTLLLEPGKISFLHSDCPDQICVRTGKISKPGQVAVCLPGKVSVRIISKNGKGNSYDGYTG